MGTLRRIAGLAVAAATAASALVAIASPAAANQDSLWFGKIGETTGTYGPNQAIRIWGDLSFKNEGCPEDGVPDFVYPTSDVYIVVPGTAVGHLVDVTGGKPNTVIQYASVFDDEVIGITTPAGSLQGGEYDVVFDTCQDGVFDSEQDSVFSRVLKVEIPGDLPPADEALTSLKEASYAEYESWKNTSRVVNGVWKLVDKALSSGCRAGNPTACALKYGNYFSPIQKQFDGLLLNQGQHYLGIYEDPPNPNFKQPVTLPATADVSALAGEAAITQALLAAVEAYKGAQEAGDEEWALAHARTVVDLYDALATQAAATGEQLQGIADLYTDAADEGIVFARKFLSRMWSAGFTPEERRTLAENGMTRAQITAYETELRREVQPHWTAAIVRETLAAQIATHDDSVEAIAAGRTAWAAIVADLVADKSTQSLRPVADAGDGYAATEGASVALDGSGSAAAPGETIESYAWDLDGDRDFDDASGATPTVTFDEPGAPVVALRVTDGDGRTAYDFVTATVARTGALPVITAVSPTGPMTKVTASSEKTFTVTATDDTGAPTVSWTVDGAPAGGTGTSFAWTAPGAPGVRQVTATATDADGHRSSVSWDVLVHRVDADSDTWTATTDCDDKDAAVHPGQLEFLGNGVDDDCDTGTPDAPVGGLTGKPYGWGHPQYNATGAGVINWSSYQLPLPTNLGDDVVKIEQGHGAGWAVLQDGSVRSWGYPSDGQLGNNTIGVTAYTPVQPTGPGGQGVLTGIRSLDESSAHVVAVRTDGKVLTWGRNNLSNLGDGSSAHYRPYPDFVLTGPGGPALTGVKSVSPGWQADYALMEDGSVMVWGYNTCDGTQGDTAPYTQYPTKVEQLEGGVRQIANGSNITLFLMKDGRVLSCGATDPQLGRKWDFTEANLPWRPRQVDGLGVGSGVVDITIHGDSAAVLKQDGTVMIWGQNTNASIGPVCGLAACTLKSPTLAPMPAGAQIIDVDNEGSATTLALRTDGTMLAWGGNTYGAAGLGDLPGSDFVPTPTVVDVGGRHIVAISASVWNGMALTRPADDPALPVPARHITATVADAAFGEATGGGFEVTLSEAHSAAIELGYTIAAGTAVAADVALTSGTVTIPAGATTVTIPVSVVDDAIDEDDETFTVALSSAGLGVQLERAQATGTIADDDAAPTVSVQSRSVVEGGTSLTDTPVRFVLSAPSGKEVVATYATADGTATDGSDYVGSTATIRFAPGETEDVVHLATIGDTTLEPNETFTVAVGTVENGTAGAAGTVTITDDEPLSVSVSAPTVAEGTGGTTTATATITVNPAPLPGTEVEVPWTVVEPKTVDDETAGDIVADSGSVVLTAEQPSAVVAVAPSATVEIEVVADDVDEEAEPFLVELGAMTASDKRTVVAGDSTTGWINDDDRTNGAPVVEAGDAVTGTEGGSIPLSGTVTDDTAGVTSVWTVTGPCTVAGTGASTTVTCTDNGSYVATLTATDADGETASDTTSLTVDNAAPVLGSVVVTPTGATVPFTDAGSSDTHSCTVVWGDGTANGSVPAATSPCTLSHAYAPGTWTASITVTDDDGASATTTKTVTVASAQWPWGGFYAPVDNLPVVNVVQAGSSVPIKFSLGGNRGLNIFAPGYPAVRQVGCTAAATDVLEQTDTPGASGLTYDSVTGRYHYVWKTSKAWAGTCRELIVKLTDGSDHRAQFRFR